MKALASSKFFALVILIFIVLFACQKNPDFGSGTTPNPPAPPTTIDLSTKVTTGAISGFVTDENEAAVVSADVSVGGKNTTTDKYGYFSVSNAEVIENAATVAVLKNGYFKAIKTFIAVTGKNAFFRIKLLPKTNAGTFTASAGGTINLTGGSSIAFPVNAIINKSTNAAYTGQVTVLAKPISAADPDLNRIMPGDLRGLNTENNLQILTTYGMMAVELTGAGGEALQIASGKKATITMPIPSALQAEAPTTIPLWYFDETKGLWIEEGKATKSGSNYVGEVSHFSYWNYDVPANYVKFKCTIVNQDNKPVANALVRVSVVGKSNNGSGYTDSLGYTGGAVPNNAQLLLQVFSGSNCNTVLYSKNFSTTATDIDLGTISVNITSYEATVSGTLINCLDQPVTNGFVIVKIGNLYYRHAVTNGNFNFTLTTCSLPADATIIAEDILASQQNISTSYTLKSGNNALGSLKACGFSTEQFIRYTLRGTNYVWSSPTDTLNSYNSGPSIALIGGTIPSGGKSVEIQFQNSGIALGSLQPLRSFFNTSASQVTDSVVAKDPINVTITEYGSAGQFVSGNFKGAVIINRTITDTLTCSFRIRKYF